MVSSLNVLPEFSWDSFCTPVSIWNRFLPMTELPSAIPGRSGLIRSGCSSCLFCGAGIFWAFTRPLIMHNRVGMQKAAKIGLTAGLKGFKASSKKVFAFGAVPVEEHVRGADGDVQAIIS